MPLVCRCSARIGMLDAMAGCCRTPTRLRGPRQGRGDFVASTYADRLPADLSGRKHVLDPMLATGGTLETVVIQMSLSGATGVTASACSGARRHRPRWPAFPMY